MDNPYYLDKFERAAAQLDRRLLLQHQMECKAGVWLRSVAFKMQKESWVNPTTTPLSFQESIFFPVWLNEEAIQAGQLYYNIHALKLRQLAGYSIQSRDFAADFQVRSEPFAKDWPNVDLDFGPLTLMQGWVETNLDDFDTVIPDLAGKFLKTAQIIDELLAERKKRGTLK